MRLIDADELLKTIPTEELLFRQAVFTAPTLDAELVRHGRWEKPQRHGVVTYDEHAYAECSCCHTPQYLAKGMSYCPNCGARMDGEE